MPRAILRKKEAKKNHASRDRSLESYRWFNGMAVRAVEWSVRRYDTACKFCRLHRGDGGCPRLWTYKAYTLYLRISSYQTRDLLIQQENYIERLAIV